MSSCPLYKPARRESRSACDEVVKIDNIADVESQENSILNRLRSDGVMNAVENAGSTDVWVAAV